MCSRPVVRVPMDGMATQSYRSKLVPPQRCFSQGILALIEKKSLVLGLSLGKNSNSVPWKAFVPERVAVSTFRSRR